ELPRNITPLANPAELSMRDFSNVLWITERYQPEAPARHTDILYFRPKSLVLGMGCERGVSLDALEHGLDLFLQAQGYARACIDTLASATVKADEPALLALAERHGWHTVFYSPEELADVPAPNPSAVVAKCIGTPGVAEPAALLAAGAERLLVEKQV